MADPTKTQPDPNAKTDARKRQDMEANLKRQEAERAAAQEKAIQAGGTGMVSQADPAAERKIVPAEPNRFQGAEFKRNQFVLDAPDGARPDDLKDPAFWAHLGERLTPWAEIMVRAADGLWFSRVIVMESGRNYARVYVENTHYLTTADVAMSRAEANSPYEVAYRGPHNQWSVIRKADRQVVHEGSQTERAAYEWLKGRLQADR